MTVRGCQFGLSKANSPPVSHASHQPTCSIPKVFLPCRRLSLFVVSVLTLVASSRSAIPSQYSTVHVADIRVQSLPYEETVRHRAYRSTIYLNNNRLKEPQWTNESVKHISFEALNRTFNLKVWPKDQSAEHPELKIDILNQSNHVFQQNSLHHVSSIFLVGIDISQPKNSSVSLYMDDSKFLTGYISYNDGLENIFIEPAWRHKHSDSIGVKESCSMLVYYESGLDSEKMRFSDPPSEGEKSGHRRSQQKGGGRVSRSSDAYMGEHTIISDVRCPLLLVADFKFFRKMGNSNWETTASYLIGLIDRINQIYLNTDFSYTERNGRKHDIKRVGFQIKRIIIHSGPSLTPGHYNADEVWRVQDLLGAFSMVRSPDSGQHESKRDTYFSHDHFCLCHLFTYEDLDDGVMGMAYRAEENLGHGICAGSGRPAHFEKRTRRNTGLTTMFNWGSAILTQAADLVTGHELGHNFGSNHDPPECIPSSNRGGAYLMNARAVSGLQRNNRLFSPCSRASIGRILANRADECFVWESDSHVGYCGNSKLDPGEACDEGRRLLSVDYDTGSNVSSPTARCCNDYCQLIDDFQCSDMNERCCRGCYFSPPGEVCRESSELSCTHSSTCTGSSAQCPDGKPHLDGTECINHGVCHKGQCSSYCYSVGQEPCECNMLVEGQFTVSSFPSTTRHNHPKSSSWQKPSPQCVLCCQDVSSNGSLVGNCKPVADIIAERLVQYYVYPDYTMCTGGTCQRGRCESNMHNDVLDYVFSAFRGDNVWQQLISLFSQNCVFSVVLLTLLFYLPICLLLHFCIDRPILKMNRKTTNSYIRRRAIEDIPRLNPPKSPSPISEMDAPIVAFFHRLHSTSHSSGEGCQPVLEVQMEDEFNESQL
ncbi:ADAM 17-like protease isoform X2 [Symsagittifera roscoffensis]|uniref:ADAM 17-like protease isoform X2 n=1 Tax=Symsagittifera roscoffensis TaxID=84072 RepID=UPI00307B7DE4